MSKRKRTTNPKRKNRYSDQGVLLPGIRMVRRARARLMNAQKQGAPQEELQALRRALREKKRVAKQDV